MSENLKDPKYTLVPRGLKIPRNPHDDRFFCLYLETFNKIMMFLTLKLFLFILCFIQKHESH